MIKINHEFSLEKKGGDNVENEYYVCPMMEEECPYCNSCGYCTMDNPMKECDDAMYWLSTITFDGEV